MHFIYKPTFLKLALFSLLLTQLSFANIDRSDKRVDFIVDEDFYADMEVMHSIKLYAEVIKVKYGTQVSIKPFPSAKLFTHDLKANMKRAAQLKDTLKASYLRNSDKELAGAVLIGNLPRAIMEEAQLNEEAGTYDYTRWETDFYFMDLDGKWTTNEETGALNHHYGENGKIGDYFEIWVSRVDPYTAVYTDKNESTFEASDKDADAAEITYTKAKAYLMNWLEKSFNIHFAADHGNSNIVSAIDTTILPMLSYGFKPPFFDWLKPLLLNSPEKYIKSLSYDSVTWVTYIGAVKNKEVKAIHFEDKDVYMCARIFHTEFNSSMINYDANGDYAKASLAAAHMFMTKNGGVTVIGSAAENDTDQNNDLFYKAARKDVWTAEAFLEWANLHVNEDDHNLGEGIYKAFYADNHWGDPFTVASARRETVDGEVVVEDIYPFMSFDDPERPWTSRDATLSYDKKIRYGRYGHSLQVHGSGYKTIISPVFSRSDIEQPTRTILMDIWVPGKQVNPYWYGDVQLHIDIPSQGVYNDWVGQALLNNLPEGWNTIAITLNERQYKALASEYNDARIVIAMNTNQNSEDYRIDNMRFGSSALARRDAPAVANEITKSEASISGMDRSGVSIHASEAGTVDVLVINANGSVVAKVSNVQLSSGTNNVSMNLNAISSGSYVVSVKSKGSVAGKVFKLR